MDGIQPDQSGKKDSLTPPLDPSRKPTEGVFALNVPYAKGSISVQVRVVGEAISPTHLARVRKYLELAESDWDNDK